MGADADAGQARIHGKSAASGGLIPVLSRPVFWALSLATACVLASGITMGTHLVPMVIQWGVPKTRAATLVSLGSLASIAGALICGWLSDNIGGARTIALICVTCISMWGLMLLRPGYLPLIAIVGVSALCVAGVVPAFTLTLSRNLPEESFGPAFGAGTLVFMMLSPSMAPITGALFVRTGAYTEAIVLLIALLALGMLLALAAAARKAHPEPENG
jgi:MFS family permease